MRFWLREIGGWLLVGLGLFMFYLAYVMLGLRMVLEAGQWSFVGIIVFRGGIHLLKVAVAARVCTQALDQIGGDRPSTLAPRPVRQRTRMPETRRTLWG
jgi:hypothetical protein